MVVTIGTGAIDPLVRLAVRGLGLTPSSSPDRISALTDVPLLVGYMTSYLLQGILSIQVFLYYRSFHRTDPRYIQITVFFCFFVECLSTALATMFVISSIISVGDLSFSGSLLGYRSVAILCGLASSLVHASYSWRIHILGGSWIIIIAVMVLSLVQCVMVSISGFGDFGVGLASSSLTAFGGSLAVDVLWLSGSAICDIIIALTLLYLLNYWHATDRLITNQLATRVERVIAIAVDTGMITAISASIELFVYLGLRDTLVPLVLFFTLPKLYANSLMATLNSRSTVSGRNFWESSDTGKDLSLPTQTKSLKNVVSRRLGMKRKTSQTTSSTRTTDIEINIQEPTPRSSVGVGSIFNIKRHSVNSVMYAKSTLKRNSIMGSSRQHRDVTLGSEPNAQNITATYITVIDSSSYNENTV